MTKLYVISGHGAGDPGASGNGYNEADVVRQISSRLKKLGGSSVVELDKSINWYASRKVDASLKKTVGSNPVLELHLDSESASAKGGHVIIRGNADKYDNALAKFLGSYFPGRSEKIVKRTNLANANRAANLGINYRLIEVCFVTNNADMKKLMNNMDEVCYGILNAFNIPGWRKDKKGWWYRNADGTWPANAWKKLDAWYWFDAKGYAVANCWKQLKNKWYLFDKNCRMLTGWAMWKKKWYYLNTAAEGTEGSMKTGWFTWKGKKYYLDPKNGDMVAGKTITIDGKQYTFDKSGVLQ